MLAAELPRIEALAPLPPAPIEDDETKFGREVAQMLGYHVLDEHRRRDDTGRQKLIDEMTLFDALVAEGIRPFQTANVRDYMAEKLAKARRGELGSGSVPAAGLIADDHGSLYDTDTHRWEWVEYYLGQEPSDRVEARQRIDEQLMAFPVSTGFPGTMVSATSISGSFGPVAYDKPVPKPVLAMAVSLKQRLPDIDFRVHALERRRIYADPFLEAIYKGAKFFIAVWDEPDFEAEYE